MINRMEGVQYVSSEEVVNTIPRDTATNDTDDETSNEEHAKNCMGLCVIPIGLNIGMLVRGLQYSGSCNIEIIPQFLQIGGGIMLTLSILLLILNFWFCCPSESARENSARVALVIL